MTDWIKSIENRIGKKAMGFGVEVHGNKQNEKGDIFKDVTPQDLLKFGLIPEFVGRLPMISTLEPLDKEALVRILKNPRIPL